MMKSNLQRSEHAAQRLAQRGFRSGDLELIMSIGTEVEGGILVREKDYLAFERAVKRSLQKVRQLVGKRIVIEGNTLITAYHAGASKACQLLERR